MEAHVILTSESGTFPVPGGTRMDMSHQEKLETIAQHYDTRRDFDYHLIRYNFLFMQGRLRGPRILEMGCANGVMTDLLSRSFAAVDVVDGSETYLKDVRSRLADRRNVQYFHSLFENFSPIARYNTIVAARALEHLDDPIAMLQRASGWLEPGGELHIVVPNAMSLHRRIGVAMGMIASCRNLNERDLRVGHKRVYDFETIRADIKAAGLVVHEITGIFLKPLSNAQMESWDAKLLGALFEVGKELPDYCAEIYVVCGSKDKA